MDSRSGDRVSDDSGGVWIVTGWAVGFLLYAGVVLAWHAGFTAAAPLVIIPAVLAVMIGAGNLISGRRTGRPAPRFTRPDPVPLASVRPSGTADPSGSGADGTPVGEPGSDR